jgi:hypothetical protein
VRRRKSGWREIVGVLTWACLCLDEKKMGRGRKGKGEIESEWKTDWVLVRACVWMGQDE